MAFKKIERAVKAKATHDAWISFSPDDNKDPRLRISIGAFRHMGEPTAIFFEWDDEDYLLRVVASAPADPAAYTVPASRRVRIPDLAQTLGLTFAQPDRIQVVRDGSFAIIADLSEYRSRP